MFTAGQLVRVLGGDYADWEGVVLEHSVENIVRVEFRVGWRMFEVELPAYQLRVAGETNDNK